jgi:hypothetical protein
MEMLAARFDPKDLSPPNGIKGKAAYSLATGQHQKEVNQYLVDISTAGEKMAFHVPMEVLALFHSKSSFYPGRLTPETEEAMKVSAFKMMDRQTSYPPMWFLTQADMEGELAQMEADPSLLMPRSCNAVTTMDAYQYLALSAMKDDPAYKDRTFRSGETVSARYETMTRWLKEAFRDWSLNGLTFELGSPGYEVATWGSLISIAVLSPDEEMRKLGQMYLDVAITELEQVSVNTVRGAFKPRPKSNELGSRFRPLRAGMFGERGGTPCYSALTFSSYTPPDAAILLHKLGSPIPRYEIRNRYPAYASKTYGSHRFPFIDKNSPALAYAWRTPEYVTGMIQYDTNYPLFSSFANHWMGVIFANLQAISLPGHNGCKMVVQDKDAIILQTYSGTYNFGRPMVELTRSLEAVERDGWVFVNNTTAYVGIRVVSGGYVWNPQPTTLRQFWVNDTWSPIIMQTGISGDYGSFEEFQKRVLAAKMDVQFAPTEPGQPRRVDSVTYTGPGCRTLTLYDDYDHNQCYKHFGKNNLSGKNKLPCIDGKPLDFDLKYTYDSPFLKLKSGDEKVVIAYPGIKDQVLDFSPRK